MTDNTNTTDDFPAFDADAARAEIVNYSPDRAIGEAAPSRAQASGAQPSFVVTMLAPADRGDIPQRLAAIADPAERARMESKLVEPIVRKLAHAANIRRGHPNGTAYDQEVAAVTNRVWDLEAESRRLHSELEAVARYETANDPDGGAPVPKPVYAVTGAARAQMEARRADIARNIIELERPGGEGEALINRAAEVELAKQAQSHEDARVLHLAEKRALEIVANERVEELARAKAARLRNQL